MKVKFFNMNYLIFIFLAYVIIIFYLIFLLLKKDKITKILEKELEVEFISYNDLVNFMKRIRGGENEE